MPMRSEARVISIEEEVSAEDGFTSWNRQRYSVGERVRVMFSTIYPITVGATGSIINVSENTAFTEIEVRLDSKQVISLVHGVDTFHLIEE